MKLKNTAKVPTNLLREIVSFVKPGPVTNFSIWFKRYRKGSRITFCGCAYTSRRHIVCRIPDYQRLTKPYRGAAAYTEGKGYRPWSAYTFEEALVALVAHELNHLHQALNPRLYRRTWSARGRFSEIDCDAYANRMIRKWRREKGVSDAKTLVEVTGPKRVFLTPRQRLEAMAAPYGIQLAFDRCGRETTYWVNAPTYMCDEDGEMIDDPYQDAHTHYCYHEAKEAIQTYIDLIESGKRQVAAMAKAI